MNFVSVELLVHLRNYRFIIGYIMVNLAGEDAIEVVEAALRISDHFFKLFHVFADFCSFCVDLLFELYYLLRFLSRTFLEPGCFFRL